MTNQFFNFEAAAVLFCVTLPGAAFASSKEQIPTQAVLPMVTTAFAGVHTAYLVAQVALPKKVLGYYKAPTGPMNLHLHVTKSAIGITAEVTSLCLLLGWCTELAPAFGWGLIPYSIFAALNILNGKSKRVGYPLSNDIFVVLAGVVISTICFRGFEIAPKVAAIFGYFTVLNGFNMLTNPGPHVKAWGGDLSEMKEKEPIVTPSVRSVGLSLLSLGTFIVCCSSNVGFTVLQSYAVSKVWWFLSLLLLGFP